MLSAVLASSSAYAARGVVSTAVPPTAACRTCSLRMDVVDDESPSDMDEPWPASAFPVEPAEQPAETTTIVDDEAQAQRRTALTSDLLGLAAGCNRGEAATEADRTNARALISELEGLGSPIALPTSSPECKGTWELIFSDTQLFRSSPFFMAGRAVCADGSQADQYDWFCDMHRAALAISTIGKVGPARLTRSVITPFPAATDD